MEAEDSIVGLSNLLQDLFQVQQTPTHTQMPKVKKLKGGEKEILQCGKKIISKSTHDINKNRNIPN